MDSQITLLIAPFFWPKLPPLGLAYLSSYLENRGIKNRVIDLNIEAYHSVSSLEKKEWQRLDREKKRGSFQDIFPYIEPFFKEIVESGTKVIGFSVFNNNVLFSLQLAYCIKKQRPDISILFGGPEVFYLSQDNFAGIPEEYKECVDYYFIGEGEQSLYRFLHQGRNGASRAIESEEIENLDLLPYPDFKQFDLQKYERKETISLLSSRGCLRRCSFCVECLLFKRYRVRSAEHILSEIRYHLQHNIRYFIFHDSLFNGDLITLEALCDGIIEKKWMISWEAQAGIRPDMEEKLFMKMKQAGCYNLFIGLESGSDSMLQKMEKGFTVADAERFLRRCKQAGLHNEISLIVGFPDETESEFYETKEFIRRNKNLIPKIAQVNPFVELRGSKAARLNQQKSSTFRIAQETLLHIEELVAFFRQEKIPYTKAFVNNLICQ